MKVPSAYALTASLAFATVSHAQAATGTFPPNLIGTWSTKSNQTLTGPGFFNPVSDTLIEPSLTGISYSFTGDGYYEEAYYRAISNPQNPNCPSGIMQWQHGSFYMNTAGELILTPIAVDGRQLLSTPCDQQYSIYTRYNQSEVMQRYSVYTDPYHNVPRLDLYKFDGSPMNPMYLAYSPPLMLPTTTLNPTATPTATSKSKVKRGLNQGMAADGLNQGVPINWKMAKGSYAHEALNPDRWWWIGLTMTGVGGLLYFGPRRMGIQI
ncbi:hypothetical protein MBLNU457_6360t1 [Dothideomycetes sp. NU457]